MSVLLLRAYSGFATGAVVLLPDDTEASLIQQGIARSIGPSASAAMAQSQIQFVRQGGNVAPYQVAGQPVPLTSAMQGPTILPVISLGTAALTAVGAAAAHVAGTMTLTEIFVPYWQNWRGIGILNGATVGSNLGLVALYNTAGALIANSDPAGAVTAGANVFQNRDFLVPVLCVPGRYFLGYQCNGATDTTFKLIAANGVNVLTGTSTGTFGTVPATHVVPTAFVTAVGNVTQLYA